MHDQPLELGGESPYAAYRLLSFAFVAGLVGLASSRAARRTFSKPPNAADVALTGAATHQLAQIITSERVTMALRSPFTWQRDEGRGGKRVEIPKEHGVHRAVGELLTCKYCIAPWITAGLIAGHVYAPAATRTVATVFAATAFSDWMTQLKTKLSQVGEAPKLPRPQPAPVVTAVR